jgi:hypothetical protein
MTYGFPAQEPRLADFVIDPDRDAHPILRSRIEGRSRELAPQTHSENYPPAPSSPHELIAFRSLLAPELSQLTIEKHGEFFESNF